ncbi:hypothetical protein MCAP1_000276 [Malassezia caprae]|uniref:Mitochondrial fission process protein 1 n=1 Tax=Malassezia caprae TaxID=1381934 RepID=A0AAF0E442_9BASI|nr:hypothetical protein MCAP1_000276 [Malassezia caprae]
MSDEVLDIVREHHEQSAHIDEGIGRYTAYTMRLKTLITTGSRYIAYSSEVGEALRPLARPAVVTTAYAISWAYIFGDVGYTCWQASKGLDKDSPTMKADLAWIAARRGTFQTLASLYLPALTIHSIVRYSGPVFAKFRSVRVRALGPSILGLLTVPLLPLIFDHPVETAVENVFDSIEFHIAAWKGDKMAQKSLEDGNLLRGYYLTTPQDESENGVSTHLAGQLAVLGLGVDMVCLPRMHRLVARHAARLTPLVRPAAATAPQYAPTAPADDAPVTSPALAMAARHFARRVLSPSEELVYQRVSPGLSHEARMRYLATRWACKEAAYKAVYPHLRLLATHLAVKRDDSMPKPSLWLEPGPHTVWRSANGASADALAESIRFHLSISHDGDYVVASVLAEQP